MPDTQDTDQHVPAWMIDSNQGQALSKPGVDISA